MAIYYMAMGLTSSTGTGIKTDPWPVQDVMLAANPKAIAVGDVLACATNGSTLQATSVAHQNPVGNILILPVDTSGDPENELRTWGFDSAGLGAGVAYTISGNDIAHVGLKIANAPARAITLATNNKKGSLYGCETDAAGTDGFYVSAAAESNNFYDCISRDAGAKGFFAAENEEASAFHRCTDIDSATGSGFASGLVSHFVSRNSVLGINGVALEMAASLAVGILEHCTVVVTSTASGLTGIKNGSSSNFRATHITNNYVEMDNQTGSVAYGSAAAAARVFFRGNVYYNALSAQLNMPTTSPEYVAPTLADAGLTNPASENFVPGNDLSSYAFRKQVLSEGLDWRDSGAFTSKIAASGGGGGMIVHPGMSGGLRG